MLVYVISSRNGQHGGVAHEYARTDNGIAVTRCDVWARGGIAEAARSDDGFTQCRWCFSAPKAAPLPVMLPSVPPIWDCAVPRCPATEPFGFWHCMGCNTHNPNDAKVCAGCGR